ncbi:MAG: glycosyltransferase family 4 protein [Elusimicrobiales bacterium]|nr:glycosyltransferase family 4 protein [Elusimicrobiales bacterium]
MKILHVTESFGWSGGAAQALYLARELRGAGQTNIFACPADGDLGLRAAADGFRVVHFRPRRDYDLKAAFALACLLAAEKPDVMQAHHPKAHAMCLIAKFLSPHKPVLVVTRRVSHPIITTWFAKRKYLSRLIDGFIAVADSVRGLLLAYGLPPERVRTVYSGTDPARFSPRPPDQRVLAELALPAGLPVVMLVGNFSGHKGQHVLLKAARELYRRGLDFALVFAGRGTDSSELKSLYALEKLPPEKVRFLGLRGDVERLLSAAAVSVNAAVKGEALSGSIRESLAMGVPAVASDISGNSEIVRDGETGLLFPPGDHLALADRLEKVLKDPALRGRFAAASVALVTEKFSTAIMGRRTLEYYRELLAKRG